MEKKNEIVQPAKIGDTDVVMGTTVRWNGFNWEPISKKKSQRLDKIESFMARLER